MLRYWNWSLSSAFSPDAVVTEDDSDDDAGFSRELRLLDAGKPRTAYGR